MNVMVVEDNWNLAELMRIHLEKAGHTVVGPIPKPDEAVAALHAYQVDCALLDINLGDSGFATPVAVAMDELKIPFVLVTGYSEHYVRGLLPLGKYRNYPMITKPYKETELINVLGLLETRLGLGTLNGDPIIAR